MPAKTFNRGGLHEENTLQQHGTTNVDDGRKHDHNQAKYGTQDCMGTPSVSDAVYHDVHVVFGAGGDYTGEVGATARTQLLARGKTCCKQCGALRLYENLALCGAKLLGAWK